MSDTATTTTDTGLGSLTAITLTLLPAGGLKVSYQTSTGALLYNDAVFDSFSFDADGNIEMEAHAPDGVSVRAGFATM